MKVRWTIFLCIFFSASVALAQKPKSKPQLPDPATLPPKATSPWATLPPAPPAPPPVEEEVEEEIAQDSLVLTNPDDPNAPPPPQIKLKGFDVSKFTGGGFGQAVPEGTLVPDGLHFYVTPHGQRYFNEKLDDFLERNGLFLQEGAVEEWKYTAPEPLVINKLPAKFAQYISYWDKVREWLQLFSGEQTIIKDPQFEVTTKNIRYKITFKKLSFRVDSRQAGRGKPISYIPALVDAVISKLEIRVDSISAVDLNNPKLTESGPAQLLKPMISLAPGSQPLLATIPIRLRMVAGGKLEVQVGTPTSNLGDLVPGTTEPKVKATLTCENDPAGSCATSASLKLPEVGAHIGGLAASLSVERLNNQFHLQDRLIQTIQAFLAGYIQSQLPPTLTKFLEKGLGQRPLSQVNLIDPPGVKGTTQPADRFRFGVALLGLDVNSDGHAHAMVGTSFEDPKNPNAPPIPADRLASGQPTLPELKENYDIAVSINQGILNRIVELSYLRGLLSNIPIGGTNPVAGLPGTETAAEAGVIEQTDVKTDRRKEDEDGKALATLKVTEIPIITIGHGVDSRHARVHIEAEAKFKLKGFKKLLKIFVKDSTARFSIDVEAEANVNQKGDLSIALSKIDLDSFDIKRSSLRAGAIVDPLLTKIAKGALKKTNDKLRQTPAVLVKALPIPKAVAGLPLKLFEARTEPNGYFTLYLSYDFKDNR